MSQIASEYLNKPVAANPVRAESNWPPVVVAGAYQTGIVLMRNLRRRGVRVSAIDHNPLQPGFKTVYGLCHRCPDPDAEPEAWLGFMVQLAKQSNTKPALIASADQYVTAIAQHADVLSQHFVIAAQSTAVQALLATKQRQYSIAADHSMPVPKTAFVVSLEELQQFASEAHFPCLMKPVHFREWERFPSGHPLLNQKVAIAQSSEELLHIYHTASDVTPEVVLQEIIQGPDTAKMVYLSCYGIDGTRLGSCMLQQLRTDPIHFGSASVVAFVDDPETDRVCDTFLRSIGYSGICELELKRDTRDGVVKLIEANPRYSVTADAAPYFGVDIAWLHYIDLTGHKVTPVSAVPSELRHIVLRRDFACFRSYHSAGLLSWRDFLISYKPPVAFFDFDIRDWRVTLDTLIEVFKIVVGPPFRRVFPKRKDHAQ